MALKLWYAGYRTPTTALHVECVARFVSDAVGRSEAAIKAG